MSQPLVLVLLFVKVILILFQTLQSREPMILVKKLRFLYRFQQKFTGEISGEINGEKIGDVVHNNRVHKGMEI